ncbi:tetratricopeptide repeat protein [uncultured Roseobacter sp.]|uniref:tetratricopeptide repeat protein n=1 Tax=uncultured Roseobacter sp. TaxID=114847 RepID=UPI00345BC3B5
MMRILLGAALLFPTTVLAAGGNDAPPSKPAVSCKGAQVYDKKTKTCVNPQESSLEREQLYQTVRHMAYAGRYHDAQTVLDAMDKNDPGRLTYMGFTHRKLGNIELGNMFYEQAIAQDPGNILARSYMGQGLVEAGDTAGALVQLRAIQEHGGAGSWSEASLRKAIETGTTYSY